MKFHEENPKSNKGKQRQRSDFDSEDDQYNKCCVICNVKGGPFWTHRTDEYKILKGIQKIKGNSKHE